MKASSLTFLRASLFELVSMNHLKSSAGFVMPVRTSRPLLSQWPALVCAAGCVLAACITLNPSAGQLWSQSASPALVAVERVVAPLERWIDQSSPWNVQAPRPVIVFGCIQPDETVVEPTRAEKLAEYGETPQVGELKTITQPVNWKRPPGETSYRFDTEQFRD